MKKRATQSRYALTSVLTAVAFLLIWFLLFVVLSFSFVWTNYSQKMLLIVSNNIQYILLFYLAIAALLILFSTWFTAQFYKEK